MNKFLLNLLSFIFIDYFRLLLLSSALSLPPHCPPLFACTSWWAERANRKNAHTIRNRFSRMGGKLQTEERGLRAKRAESPKPRVVAPWRQLETGCNLPHARALHTLHLVRQIPVICSSNNNNCNCCGKVKVNGKMEKQIAVKNQQFARN